MKIKDIVKKITEKEGLKDQVSIGNVREIVAIISDLLVSDGCDTLSCLITNGKKRTKRKKK